MKRFFKFFVFVLLGLALVACDTNNTDSKSEGNNDPVSEPQSTNTDKLVYVLEFSNSFGQDVEFVYDEASNTYYATASDLTGVVGIEFYLNNGLISTENTTVTGVGSDSSAAFYVTSTNTSSFRIGDVVIDDAKFVYDPVNKALAITYKLVEEVVNVEVTYAVSPGAEVAESGTATLGEGGKYYFTITMNVFNRIDIKCNGQIVNAVNTNVTGAFKNQTTATWTKDLYLDDLNTDRFVYYMETANTYTFIYTPARNGNMAQLEIQWQEPQIPQDGLYAENVQHFTVETSESNGVYTVTLTADTSQFPGVALYYDGVLLTPDNCNVTGAGYYTSWAELNGTTDKVGIYYQPDDGQSVPGWFSINPASFTFVYDSASNTLTITVK